MIQEFIANVWLIVAALGVTSAFLTLVFAAAKAIHWQGNVNDNIRGLVDWKNEFEQEQTRRLSQLENEMNERFVEAVSNYNVDKAVERTKLQNIVRKIAPCIDQNKPMELLVVMNSAELFGEQLGERLGANCSITRVEVDKKFEQDQSYLHIKHEPTCFGAAKEHDFHIRYDEINRFRSRNVLLIDNFIGTGGTIQSIIDGLNEYCDIQVVIAKSISRGGRRILTNKYSTKEICLIDDS